MLGCLFRVEAKPGKLEELIAHLKWCIEVAKEKEPETWRFEFFQDPEDDQALYVYEAYPNEAGFEAHKQNEPYQSWNAGRSEELTTSFKLIFGDTAIASTAM